MPRVYVLSEKIRQARFLKKLYFYTPVTRTGDRVSGEQDASQGILRLDVESGNSTVVEGQGDASVYHQTGVKATGFHSKLAALLSVRAALLLRATRGMIYLTDYVYHV